MSELSPEARRLLMAARADAEPTAADRARVQAMVVAAIAMPAASAAAATSAGAQVGVGVTSGFLSKLGAAVLVTSLTVAGGYGAYRATTSDHKPAVTATSVVAATRPTANAALPSPDDELTAPVTTPSVAVAVPAPVSSATRIRTRASLPARRSTPERSAQVAKEIVWISSAESALDQRSPALALQALQQHARLFPTGELRQERLGLRAIALCALHGGAASMRGARAYLAHYPSSMLAERVRDACRVPSARGDK